MARTTGRKRFWFQQNRIENQTEKSNKTKEISKN